MKIAHLSDIQIRVLKRHQEFRTHFENLYISLREEKPDAIVLTGDILHNKSTVSPEQYDLLVDFSTACAEIAHFIPILGNHDCVLSNMSRLDSISPVIKALAGERIHYYKHSGVYEIDKLKDTQFVVYSCVDPESAWPKKEDIDPNKISIALFHGMFNGCILQNGVKVEGSPYDVKEFLETVDYVMAGDIHKVQALDPEERAWYAGSLIQQNYGESLDKGYLIWDIESKEKHSVRFVSLPKVCPYYTLHINDDLEIPDKNLQQRARIRIKSRPVNVFEKKALQDKINSRFNPVELVIDDADETVPDIKISIDDTQIENLTQLETQERLIREFFQNEGLSEETFQKLFAINKIYNAQARDMDDTLRNIQYVLGKMEYHNLLSYGENNVFDFSKYHGTLGILGPNGSGKSSLATDIPLYTIYNKITKKGVVKNDLLINENKEDCAGAIEIFTGRDKHVIRRATHVYSKSGKKSENPVYQGKTDVEYEIYKEDGTVVNRTGEDRQTTDKNIRKIFGTPEDFMATSMAPQWHLLGIIDAGGTERQKLIGRYFDIDIFMQKHKLANEDWKLVKGRLKSYENRNFQQEIREKETEWKQIKQEFKTLKAKQQELQQQEKQIEDEIYSLQSKLWIVPSFKSEKELRESIAKTENDLKGLTERKEKAEKEQEQKNNLNIELLRSEKKIYEKIDILNSQIESLKNGCACPHDDDCSLHKRIRALEEETGELARQPFHARHILDQKIEEWKSISPDKAALHSEKLITQVESVLGLLSEDLESLLSNKEKLEGNRPIEEKINALKASREQVRSELSLNNKSIVNASSKMGALQANLQEILRCKADYEEIKNEYDAYDYFLRAMSKDGIMSKIISNNIHIINSEIRKILSKGVNFSVEVESASNGRAIEIYFKHEKSKRRRIEICSGMEKSISALVIRAALIKITSLPKSNVFILDEPFGSLDVELKDAVVQILEYLKTMFDLIILITHDEYFKDIVDHVVEIARNEEGYSKIME